jgi:prophage endopeptidase
MNSFKFVLVTALILFAAFALGWFSNWLLHRFTRVSQADLGELDRMAQALHESEEMRDQAIVYIQEREASLTNQLSQTEAELRATMEGLREARSEVENLHTYIEQHNA